MKDLEKEFGKTMKRGRLLDIITTIMCLVFLGYLVYNIIAEVKINNNILNQPKESCIKLNGDYYCKVEE